MLNNSPNKFFHIAVREEHRQTGRAATYTFHTCDRSILLGQMRCSTGLPSDAVTRQIRSQALAHGVLSEPTSDQTDGSHDKVKDHTKNNSSVDPTEHVTYRHPTFVRPEQTVGKRDGWNKKTNRQYDRPPSRILVAKKERPEAYDSEDAADD